MVVNKVICKKLSYKVVSGDMLWDISCEYDVIIVEFVIWNKFKKDVVLCVG